MFPMEIPNCNVVGIAKDSFTKPSAQRFEDRRDYSMWSLYHQFAQDYDAKTLKQWDSDMNVLLIFAALFSGVVAAFINESLGSLKEDYSETSSKLLRILVAESSKQNVTMAMPLPFQPDRSSVIANSLWITSFVLSVGFSLAALLCKQWLCSYAAHLSPNLDIRMLQRHSRLNAFERWHVSAYITFLPILLHISIIIFLAGLWVYLGLVNVTVKNVAAAFIGAIGVGYVAFTLLPLFTTAPFVSPVTLSLTWIMQTLVDYVSALIYAVFLFFLTVVRVGVQEHSTVLFARALRQWAIVVRYSFPRVLRMSSLARWGQPERGEKIHAEALSWLIHQPLDADTTYQVVKSLSSVQSYESQLVFSDQRVEIILLDHLQYHCFSRPVPDLPMQLIPEQVPFALSCLDALSAIESSTSTSVQNAAWMGIPTDEMIGLLLHHTSGHDRLRVLAASVWLVNDHNQSLIFCQSIRQHIMDHIDGTEELPDQIVKALVDALHPSLGFISVQEMTRLLRKYLDRDALPSACCLHSILFNIWNRDPTSWVDPTRQKLTSMQYIAHLLESKGTDRSLYLRLVRKLPLVNGGEPIADADLSRCLIHLLDLNPSFNEKLVIDVLETISTAPASCHGYDQALLHLAQVYERQTGGRLSRSAITAIASFTEFVFRSHRLPFDPLDTDMTKQIQYVVRVVAEKLVRSPSSYIDTETVFGVYVLSMVLSHIDLASVLTPSDELARALVKLLSSPGDDRQSFVFHHTLRVVRVMARAGGSLTSILAGSIQLLARLAVDDDPRVRWISLEILTLLSFHIRRDEYVRILETVRDDIQTRSRSTETQPFVDPNWRALTDAVTLRTRKLRPPEVVLVQRLHDDLAKSGINEQLGAVSKSMICDSSVLIDEDFPWLSVFFCRVNDER